MKLRNKLQQMRSQDGLTAQEKAQMRDVLLRHVAANPVRKYDTARQSMRETRPSLSLLIAYRFMFASLLIAALVATSGGAALAAEHSLPGDFLYPIKVEFNEQVVSALALSDEAQAEWEVQRMERRLAEAEELQVKGKLTAETKQEVNAQIQQQSDRTDQAAIKLEQKGKAVAAASVASRLEATLRGHTEVILSVVADDEDAADIAVDVSQRARAAIERRVRSEQEVSIRAQAEVQKAAENKMEAAVKKIENVQEFFDKKIGNASTEIAARATASFADAKDVLVQAQMDFEAEQYAQAFAGFQHAMRLAQQSQILLQASIDLRVDRILDVMQDRTASSTTLREDDRDEIKNRARQEIDVLIDTARTLRERNRDRDIRDGRNEDEDENEEEREHSEDEEKENPDDDVLLELEGEVNLGL